MAAAERLGLAGQPIVSMIERGTKPLTQELAQAMASLYGVSTETVLKNAPVATRVAEPGTSGEPGSLGVASPKDEDTPSPRLGVTSRPAFGSAPSKDSEPSERPKAAASADEYRACSSCWFVGPDAHSTRRRELRTAALKTGLAREHAEQVAVASHPPLEEALATFGFYRELQVLSDSFCRQSQLSIEATAALAGRTIRSMHAAAQRHGAEPYAEALATLLSGELADQDRGTSGEASASTPERPRALEELRDVVKHGRRLIIEEPGTGSDRQFDAFVTATRGEEVLAAGFDHQRGVVRVIDLSSLPTPPRLATGSDRSFDPPNQAVADEARRLLQSHPHDEESIRTTSTTGAENAVTRSTNDQPRHPTGSATADPISTRSALPASIELTIGGHHLFLDRQVRPTGAVVFLLTDPDTGQPARAGVRLIADASLPDTFILGEQRLPLAPAYRWLPEERQFSDEPEPFDRTRASRVRLAIGGRIHDLDLRITRRSTTQWLVRAKLTPTSEAGATSQEVDVPPRPSIKGAPVLPTPLFKLDGRWNWRWSVRTGDEQLVLPREFFEMNGIEAESVGSVTLPEGSSLEVVPTKHGTGLTLQKVGALRETSRGKPGDFVFIGTDIHARLTFRRVTKQLMGRVQSHMKMATLLCGLTDDHPTLSAVLWALGVADESGTIDDAIAICEQRSDGPLARELRAHANEASLPPDLDEIFKAL